MEKNVQSQKKGNQSIVIVIVVLIIAGVIIYALTQNQEKATKTTKSEQLENQIELTEENLTTTWDRIVDGKEYYITFERGGRITYGCMTEGTMHHEFMADGKYSISEKNITFNYTLDEKEYNETYSAQVSKEKLMLLQIKDGATALVGTYINENYDFGSEVVSSETTNAQSDEQNSTSSNQSTSESTNNTDSKSTQTSEANTNTDSNDWKNVYTKYIDTNGNIDDSSYKLLFIDNDDIPELFICTDGQSKVCTCYNGSVTEISLPMYWGETYYEEKSGKFMQKGYRGDESAILYSLKDGRFSSLHNGTYDETNYYIDGQAVAQNEYNNEVNSWLDLYRSSSVSGSAVGYIEIMNLLCK